MKLYDITQELFSSEVYPGDVPPTYKRAQSITNGDSCNLTVINMCAHNGTHIDAPYHFYKDGKTIDQIDVRKFVGKCTVVDLEAIVNELNNQEFDHAVETSKKDPFVLKSCKEQYVINHLIKILESCEKKLLIKGNITITLEMAKLFNQYRIELIGIEGQSVGTEHTQNEVHLELLGKEVVIIEGLRLSQVPEGNYILSAAPLKLGGCDGAPCRAILMST